MRLRDREDREGRTPREDQELRLLAPRTDGSDAEGERMTPEDRVVSALEARAATSTTAPHLIDVILAEFERDDSATAKLADRLAPWLARHIAPAAPAADGWLDTADAAEYLGISRTALHKLTAAREIAFAQDGPGCKCWFKRPELDAWRRGEWKGTTTR
jgi:excisionase family DNA binding protein